jgi:hypothetical protein
MRVLYLFCFFVLMLDSCIEPFNIELSTSESLLVVDGMITDQPGPYYVRLFRSAPLDDQLSAPNWVKAATILMVDDQGNSEKLTEATPGNYQTQGNSFRGVVGRTYHIEITLNNEERFESIPEKLLPVGNIENVRYEFVQNEDPKQANHLNPKNGFNIFIDAEVLPEQNSHVRWRTTGTFEIRTYPAEKTAIVASGKGGTAIIPDPPACSGWTYSAREGLKNVRDCKCCDCWATLRDEMPLLSDQKFVNENQISKYNLAFIPASRRFFWKKYYLEIEQMSISESTFAFWEAIKKQKQTGSDLFQTPPPKAVGNLVPVGDTKSSITGIFTVSAVTKKSFFIDRAEVPYDLPPIDTLKESCLEAYRYTTNVKPIFWQ